MIRTSFEVQQMMPAPGWRVYECIIPDEGKAEFSEVPVVGWGIMKGVESNEEGKITNRFTEVNLLVFKYDAAHPIAYTDWVESDNSTLHALPPGDELTDELKAEMETATSEKMQVRERLSRVS